jgi:hypothetical protein
MANITTASRKRRFGDRKDGRLLRTVNSFYRFIPFVMKTRNDATNYYTDRLDITEAEVFLRNLRQDGYKNIGILHLFLAAYVRCVSMMPALNRFIAGQRIFARNKIEVCMIVKKKLSTESGETSIRVIFEPTDTIFNVYNKINIEIEKIKEDSDTNNTENVADTLMKIPRLALKFVMRLLCFLDYFGKLPYAITSASPFHASLVISDLGSIGIGKIYHHLYDFGNLPVFIAFGRKYRAWVLDKNGVPAEKRYVDYGVSTDERICDGYYYALSFRYMNHFMHHPEKLLDPPETVNEDVE